MDKINSALALETNPRTRVSLLAIRDFIVNGKHLKKIASEMDRSIRTIQNWFKRYMKEGIAGLSDKSRSSRPLKVPKITPDNFMKRKDNPVIPKQTIQEIDQELGCKYARAYVRALLHEHGYSPKTAQKIHVKLFMLGSLS